MFTAVTLTMDTTVDTQRTEICQALVLSGQMALKNGGLQANGIDWMALRLSGHQAVKMALNNGGLQANCIDWMALLLSGHQALKNGGLQANGIDWMVLL
jgi:hypothetical protein